MEEYDRVYPDQIEDNDVIRVNGQDYLVKHVLDDDGDTIRVSVESLDTGDHDVLFLHPDLLVSLVTL